MGKKQFCFFQTAESGNRAPDSGVKGSGANHYPRAPALPREAFPTEFLSASASHFLISRQDLFFPMLDNKQTTMVTYPLSCLE